MKPEQVKLKPVRIPVVLGPEQRLAHAKAWCKRRAARPSRVRQLVDAALVEVGMRP